MEKKAPTETKETEAATPPKRRRRRFGFASFFSLCVAGLVFFVLSLALTGRTVAVPTFIHDRILAQVNAQLNMPPLRIGGSEFGVDRQGVPQILMNNVQIADAAGGAVAQLNWLGAELSFERILRGEFAAERIFLTGAQITVRRTSDGRFVLASGPSLGTSDRSIAEILALIDREMSAGTVSSLNEIVAAGVVLTLEDARSGRIWQATNASATLRKTAGGLSLSITSDVFNGTDNLASLQVSLNRSRVTDHVQLGVTVGNMPAADIALQSPILSWLSILDAPISGAVRTELDETGALVSFAGTLDISEGALRPTETAEPVAFEAAKAYFTFDPTRQRIDFSEINVQSSLASGIATGHTYLTEFNGDWPGAYLGQFQLTDVAYEGGETFASSVALQDIRADLRLRLDPFEVELGHVAIDNQGVPIAATGRVSADDAGWHVAVDATTSVIDAPRVLEFWPQRVAPITRSWVARNLLQGTLINPALGLRFDGGEEPDLALSFNFDEGKARFLPDMPYLENASGRAVLQNHRFALELASGEIAAEDGEIVDAQGSSFIVLDTRPKPSFGEINVAASGRLEAVLDILNNRPLRLMERAGRPVDLAEARVDGQATITLPLKDGIETEEITYAVTANLTDVSSRELVQDRELTSPGLQLTASPDAIAINGPARLDRVPITANWRQPLGANAANGAEISGRITLSEDTVDAFDLPLPNEFLRGESEAEYQIDLPAENDASPLLTLRSDLYGLGFSLPSIGWRKTIEERGELRLSARLGDTPEIEELTLETEDLSFEGNLSLAPDGSLQRAEFGALELGDWLDADIVVTPPPDGGPPSVAVRGGTLDLRQMQLGAGGTTSAGGAMPVTLELDRLTVSDTIAFAPLRGRVQMGAGGLSGTFEARINGGTAIQGVLSPANAGTAIRITSADAAGVLRDAGLTPNAQSGSLDLVLTPVANTGNGTFDGEFLIEDMRLKDAPAMAELLDAVSVVGLLDQLGGAGIRFETIDGSFRMNRRQIRLRQAAAVGPSMGISADGIFDLQRRRMDLQGVVSPVYFLNGIGSFLTRRGEGLFGFNYRMAGAASDPSVRVNPLSILTPGAFRQIFRRAPPGG